VEEAALPERPGPVTVVATTAESITVSVEPPTEDNCLNTNAFQIDFKPRGTFDLERQELFAICE